MVSIICSVGLVLTVACDGSATPTPDLEATGKARLQATIAAMPTATPPPAPTVTPLPVVDPFQWIQGGEPDRIFGGYVAPFLQGRSAMAQQSLKNLLGPARASFLLSAPESTFVSGDFRQGFEEFFALGRPILGPKELGQAFVDAWRNAVPLGAKAKFLASNEGMFDLYMAAMAPYVSPMFRDSWQEAAEDRYAIWYYNVAPGETFIAWLAENGGALFPSTGDS